MIFPKTAPFSRLREMSLTFREPTKTVLPTIAADDSIDSAGFVRPQEFQFVGNG